MERPNEARDHFARGARYNHDHSPLKLLLYEKQNHRFDYTLHLLTSTVDPRTWTSSTCWETTSTVAATFRVPENITKLPQSWVSRAQ